MPATHAVLIPAKLVETAQTTQYTAPANGRGALIDKLSATNISAGAETISISLVADGAASNNDLIVKTKSLGPAETYTFPEIAGAYLAPGNIISTACSAASAINFRVNGRELT